jgi:putative transposase
MGAPLAFTWSWPGIDPATINPTTVTVSRDPCGRWYVSLTVDIPEPEKLPATGRGTGVDLGITDFAVTSDGQRIANPRHLERRARNLARYQRRLARCQQGSANRAKAKAKVARAHRKVRAARTDFLHKASTGLVRDYDVIVLEDKAARYRRRVIVVDRWYPSSKTCSACGYLLAALSLDRRHWTCPSCGTRHDRDINAAKNILAAGLAVAGDTFPGRACGADVRHPGTSRVQSAVKQEPQPARAGIPSYRSGSSQAWQVRGWPPL